MFKFYKIKTRDDILTFIVLLALVFILSYFIVTAMKLYFKTPRPCVGLPDCPTTYSFPSRHAAVVFALVTAFALQQKYIRINVFLFLLAFVISAYRLLISVHRPEDIIAGIVIGVIIGFLSKPMYDFYQKNLYYKLKFR